MRQTLEFYEHWLSAALSDLHPAERMVTLIVVGILLWAAAFMWLGTWWPPLWIVSLLLSLRAAQLGRLIVDAAGPAPLDMGGR